MCGSLFANLRAVDTERPDQNPSVGSQDEIPAGTLEGQLAAVTAERDTAIERAERAERERDVAIELLTSNVCPDRLTKGNWECPKVEKHYKTCRDRCIQCLRNFIAEKAQEGE